MLYENVRGGGKVDILQHHPEPTRTTMKWPIVKEIKVSFARLLLRFLLIDASQTVSHDGSIVVDTVHRSVAIDSPRRQSNWFATFQPTAVPLNLPKITRKVTRTSKRIFRSAGWIPAVRARNFLTEFHLRLGGAQRRLRKVSGER
jgi:hypothetical protein